MIFKKLLIVLLCLFVSGCEFKIQIDKEEPKVSSRVYFAMSTSMEVTLYNVNSADKHLDAIGDIYKMYDRYFDPYISYSQIVNLHTLNANSGKEVVVDESLLEIIETSLWYYEKTNGYFNPLLGDVTQIWKEALKSKTVPTKEEITQAMKYTNASEIVVNRDLKTVMIPSGSKIDLGGLAKGYVNDKIVEYLNTFNITSYLISSGTSSISCGIKYDNTPFKVGITNPDNLHNYLEIVNLKNKGISTSSYYLQYFEVDNTRYHHIINAKTGYPENKYDLVSVIGNNNTDLDVLSTACYSMTLDDIKKMTFDVEYKIYKGGSNIYA